MFFFLFKAINTLYFKNNAQLSNLCDETLPPSGQIKHDNLTFCDLLLSARLIISSDIQHFIFRLLESVYFYPITDKINAF